MCHYIANRRDTQPKSNRMVESDGIRRFEKRHGVGFALPGSGDLTSFSEKKVITAHHLMNVCHGGTECFPNWGNFLRLRPAQIWAYPLTTRRASENFVPIA